MLPNNNHESSSRSVLFLHKGSPWKSLSLPLNMKTSSGGVRITIQKIWRRLKSSPSLLPEHSGGIDVSGVEGIGGMATGTGSVLMGLMPRVTRGKKSQGSLNFPLKGFNSTFGGPKYGNLGPLTDLLNLPESNQCSFCRSCQEIKPARALRHSTNNNPCLNGIAGA